MKRSVREDKSGQLRCERQVSNLIAIDFFVQKSNIFNIFDIENIRVLNLEDIPP
jgi:hypothetical protein